MKKGLLTVLLCLAPWCMAAVSIIELQHADGEQLLPLIAGQLGPESSVSVYQNRIVLDATMQETRAIRALIEKLDAGGRPLLITVKTAGTGGQQQTDNSVRIKHKSTNQHSATTITTTTRSIGSSTQGGGQQSLRATEGVPAFVAIGQSRLYRNEGNSGQWQPAESGFYATAWVNGGDVSINIGQQQADFDGQGRINHQQLQSRVSGRLGQWMPVGSLVANSKRQQGGSTRRERNSMMIYLKIETLD